MRRDGEARAAVFSSHGEAREGTACGRRNNKFESRRGAVLALAPSGRDLWAMDQSALAMRAAGSLSSAGPPLLRLLRIGVPPARIQTESQWRSRGREEEEEEGAGGEQHSEAWSLSSSLSSAVIFFIATGSDDRPPPGALVWAGPGYLTTSRVTVFPFFGGKWFL
ncbi:hypothetical protein EYF80_006752 [Liparis tanakae]|uniref:Uncharacterized protein n=1 Tax=Liparis tanakae TaxID=230148 RepID=A0A4Z2IYS6_9TELE|nr:hypothetical protein EYF80_006752 [Liparis tanakae]